jgi:hypothetical protein
VPDINPNLHIRVAQRTALTNAEQAQLRGAANATKEGLSFTVGRQGSTYTVTRVNNQTLKVTQTQQSRTQTIWNSLCSLFGDRLTGSQRLRRDLERLLDGNTTVVSTAKELDPFAATVLLCYDDAEVARDVNSAMKKIKAFVEDWGKGNTKVAEALEGAPREAYFYNNEHKDRSLKWHLEQWDDSWSKERTCALLMDLGLKLKSATDYTEFLDGKKKIMLSSVMAESRGESKVNTASRWAQEFTPQGTKMQSGVSATTGSFLILLRHLNGRSKSPEAATEITNTEIESLMVGFAKSWEERPWYVRARGFYHTPAEVWTSYNRHLEIDKVIEKTDKVIEFMAEQFKGGGNADPDKVRSALRELRYNPKRVAARLKELYTTEPASHDERLKAVWSLRNSIAVAGKRGKEIGLFSTDGFFPENTVAELAHFIEDMHKSEGKNASRASVDNELNGMFGESNVNRYKQMLNSNPERVKQYVNSLFTDQLEREHHLRSIGRVKELLSAEIGGSYFHKEARYLSGLMTDMHRAERGMAKMRHVHRELADAYGADKCEGYFGDILQHTRTVIGRITESCPDADTREVLIRNVKELKKLFSGGVPDYYFHHEVSQLTDVINFMARQESNKEA